MMAGVSLGVSGGLNGWHISACSAATVPQCTEDIPMPTGQSDHKALSELRKKSRLSVTLGLGGGVT